MFLVRAFLFLMLLCTCATAQTSPGFVAGRPICANYPSAACPAPANPFSLNGAFQTKQDYPIVSGAVPGVGGVTFLGTPSVGWVPIATSNSTAVWTAVPPSFTCPGCVPGNITQSVSTTMLSDGGISATLLSQAPPFKTFCNPTGITAVPQWCDAITTVAPLGISNSAINVNTTAANGQFIAGAGNSSNTGGASNIGIGPSALVSLTSGTGNVVIGSSAAPFISSGANNLALGVNALVNLTTASSNVAIGSSSLASNVTGQSNVGIGVNAILHATGGSNTGVGPLVGPSLTSGGGNSFFGNSAGGGITTGNNNTVLGSCAGLASGLTGAIALCDGVGTLRYDWGSTTVGTATLAGPVDVVGQLYSTAGTPTIASGACGTTTNGTVGAGSTNQSGFISIGAAATTTCTISWSATLPVAPNSCVFFPGNAAAAVTGATVAWAGAPSTASVVLNGSALANTVYRYLCL